MHDLTVSTPYGQEIALKLNMPIRRAHAYASAIASEFMANAYTLNEALHEWRPTTIPESLRRAIDAERRWLTDADDCEGLA